MLTCQLQRDMTNDLLIMNLSEEVSISLLMKLQDSILVPYQDSTNKK